MIELEALAVNWSMSKCRQYILGLLTFDLVIDQRPLVSIFNTYNLDAIENPRLRLTKMGAWIMPYQTVMKEMPYVFTAIWQKGSEHAIPDTLLRHAVDVPLEDDEETAVALQCDVQQVVILAVTSVVYEQPTLHDPGLDGLQEHVCCDIEYCLLSSTSSSCLWK